MMLFGAIEKSSSTCLDYPNSIIEDIRIQKILLRKDPIRFLSLYDNSSHNYNSNLDVSFAADIFKEFIMENLLDNIKYLDLFKKVLDLLDNKFSHSDQQSICDAILQQNIIISPNTYGWILNNNSIIINSIVHSKTPSQINALAPFSKVYLSNYTETVQIEDFVESLRKMNYKYIPGMSPEVLLKIPEIALVLIENNPYIIETLSELNVNYLYQEQIKTKIADILEEKNYVFSPRTPHSILSFSPKYELLSYEMFFEEYTNIPRLNRPFFSMTNEEMDLLIKRQYEIFKEHNSDLHSVNFTNIGNPYVFIDAMQEGIISEERIEKLSYIEKMQIQSYMNKKSTMQFDDSKQIMQNTLLDIENFDNYSFNGICVTPEYIDEIINLLIACKYKVTEKTPHFLLLNTRFLEEYVLKNQSIDGIDPRYIARQFTLDNLRQNQNILKIYKYCEDLNTPIDIYITVWGIDLTIGLITKFGSLIKYLNPNMQYTIDSAKDALETYLESNLDMDINTLILFYKKLEKDVTEDTFKKNPNLALNDQFILYAYSKKKELLFQYKGSSDDILILAIDISYLFIFKVKKFC